MSDPANPLGSAGRIGQTGLAGLNRVNGPAGTPAAQPKTGARPSGTSFAETLQKQLQTPEQAANPDVRFSNHAQKRLDSRNIALGKDSLVRLSAAVDKAEQRGGKESLVLMDDLAFIVNVRDRLVVTAVDDAARREGIFTQIDTVVFAPSKTE